VRFVPNRKRKKERNTQLSFYVPVCLKILVQKRRIVNSSNHWWCIILGGVIMVLSSYPESEQNPPKNHPPLWHCFASFLSTHNQSDENCISIAESLLGPLSTSIPKKKTKPRKTPDEDKKPTKRKKKKKRKKKRKRKPERTTPDQSSCLLSATFPCPLEPDKLPSQLSWLLEYTMILII